MTYAPARLRELRAYLAGETGLSAVSLGIVGDTAHVKGYHCGRDRIYSPAGQGAADYSVRTARDRAGLTDAASAMDIGRWSGLRSMSAWLVIQARQNAPGTSDLREIIYSPDGQAVLRWDRERGPGSAPRPGEADDSHRTHTHISWYRDSEHRDKVALFRRYFEPPEDDIVNAYSVPGSFSLLFPKGTPVYPSPTATAPTRALGEPLRALVCGQDRATAPTRYLVDGGGASGAPALMGWLPVAAGGSRRDETWEAGRQAAAAAAATAPR